MFDRSGIGGFNIGREKVEMRIVINDGRRIETSKNGSALVIDILPPRYAVGSEKFKDVRVVLLPDEAAAFAAGIGNLMSQE